MFKGANDAIGTDLEKRRNPTPPPRIFTKAPFGMLYNIFMLYPYNIISHNAFGIVVMSFISFLCLHLHIENANATGSQADLFRQDINENYFTNVSLLDIPIALLIVLFWIIVFAGLTKAIDRFSARVVCQHNFKQITGKKFAVYLLIIAGIIAIFWLPYILSWFPGGLFADTYKVLEQVATGKWTNRHTFFYTACWSLCFEISNFFGSDVEGALAIMTGSQILFMALSLSYSVIWLRNKKVNSKLLILTLAFYAVFPFFPLFALSLWTDVFFCIALFLYSLKYIDLCITKAVKNVQLIQICILLLLVSFSRNNGSYVVFASYIILLILKHRLLRSTFKQLTITMGALIATVLIIQGPVYGMLGWSIAFEENIGLPLQQIAAVAAYDGNLSSEQIDYLNSILPISVWAEEYAPLLVDEIKWNSSFDEFAISNNIMEFWLNYISIGLANPIIYLKAALLNCCGFWDPFIGWGQDFSNYNIEMWFKDSYSQQDTIEAISGCSIRDSLIPPINSSSALYVWIMLISMTIFVNNRRTSIFKAAMLSPIFSLWLTLLIATPIAISQRYFFTAVFMLPAFMILPFLVTWSESEKNPAPRMMALPTIKTMRTSKLFTYTIPRYLTLSIFSLLIIQNTIEHTYDESCIW